MEIPGVINKLSDEVRYLSEYIWVFKLDPKGRVKWQKTYGRDHANGAFSIAITSNEDIIVAGSTTDFGAGSDDVWVLRLDENGNVKWQKTYGGSGVDWAFAVTLTDNGDIIISGSTNSFGAGGYDIWVLRLDEDGNIKWQRTYGGERDDLAHAVAIAPNGDIIVAGETESFGAGDHDAWVLRLDSDGNVKWQKTYGGSDDDWVNAISITPNKRVIIGGNYLLTLDPNGNPKWTEDIGTQDIKILQDGTVVFAGGSNVGRININYIPQYMDDSWGNVSIEVYNTNAQVYDTSAQIRNTNAKIQELNVELHNINVQPKVVWTYLQLNGTLLIDSNSSEVSVCINGAYRGQAPLDISLEPGVYEVNLTIGPIEGTIEIRSNTITTVTVSVLIPQTPEFLKNVTLNKGIISPDIKDPEFIKNLLV